MAFVGTLPAAFLWPCFCRRREQQESLRWAKAWLILLPQHPAIPPWSCDRTRVHHQQALCRKPTSPQDGERCCGPTWLCQGCYPAHQPDPLTHSPSPPSLLPPMRWWSSCASTREMQAQMAGWTAHESPKAHSTMLGGENLIKKKREKSTL